jgi:hypothetical protein
LSVQLKGNERKRHRGERRRETHPVRLKVHHVRPHKLGFEDELVDNGHDDEDWDGDVGGEECSCAWIGVIKGRRRRSCQ